MQNKFLKSIKIGRTVYDIEFVSKFEDDTKDQKYWGEFDSDESKIRIKSSLSDFHTIETLVHEILHAIEAEYGVYMPHPKIEKLEGPIAKIIYNNFFKKAAE